MMHPAADTAPAAETACPPTGSQLARRRRFAALEGLRDFTAHKRVRVCAYTRRAEHVTLRWNARGTSGWSGLVSCGSVWACPVCAARIAEHRRNELAAMMLAHSAKASPTALRGQFVLLTLTMRHRQGEALAPMWDDLSTAWRRLTAHRSWRTLVKPHLRGWVRVVETTHGCSGWHVHLHVMLFVNADTDVPGLLHLIQHGADNPNPRGKFRPSIFSRWFDVLDSLGRTADTAAQDVRHVTTDTAAATFADYFTKATLEVTRSDLKSGKVCGRCGLRHRPPFRILDDLIATRRTGVLADTATPRDDRLWSEWETASQGRRQMGYSLGLRAELLPDVDELDDQAVVDQALDGDDVLTLTGESWHLVRRAGLRGPLLDTAETCATVDQARKRCTDLLRAHGIPWGVPNLPPRR